MTPQDVEIGALVPGGAEAAAGGVESFGYRQELKRTLSAFDLLVYGLVFITPIAPWSSFGFVFNASHGMVPLVYVVGLVAMVFTARSYMVMSAAFPVAGSVYAYAGKGVGESAGFLAGWALLLDYLLLPTLIYVICAVAINSVLPMLPKPLLVAAFLALNTTVNIIGVESTAKLSVGLLFLQILLLAVFMGLCLIGLAQGTGGAHLSMAPLFDAQKVSPALIFGALSLAALSFLGFDAISTLTEEAKGGARAVGFATMLSLLVAAGLFVVQTYLASLFVLDRTSFAPGDEAATAFFIIAKTVGGEPMRWAVSILGVLLSGLAGMATLSDLSSYMAGIAPLMLLIGVGQGFVLAPLTVAAVQGVASDDAGAASGVVNVAHQLGGSLGLSILVVVFAWGGAVQAGATTPLAQHIAHTFVASAVMLAGALALVLLFIVRPRRHALPASGLAS